MSPRFSFGSLLLLAALTLFGGPALRAQVGGAAVVFLQIEPDSRAAGMGNAGVAVADNASAMFWNPAGLGFQRGSEASLTFSPWLPSLDADLYYIYNSGRYYLEGVGTLGAHITFLNLGEQEYRDEFNNSRGTFRAYDVSVGTSFGTKVTENLAVGTGIRFIYSNLTGGVQVGAQDTQAGVAVAVDLAALYRAPTLNLGGVPIRPSLGFNLANMGSTIQYSDNEQRDPIPTNLRFGAALSADFDEFNSVTWAIDFNKLLIDFENTEVVIDDTVRAVREPKPFYEAIFSAWKPITVDLTPGDQDDLACGETNENGEVDEGCSELSVWRQLTIGTGLEYWYSDLFAMRAGYFYEDPYNGNRQFLTFGAGIRYNVIGVDLSYIYPLEENSPLADTIRFSLLFNIAP